MYRFFDFFKRKDRPPESKFIKAANRFKNLKPSSLSKVFSSDMSIFKIQSYKSNIDSYAKYVTTLSQAIVNDEPLANLQIERDVKTIYVRDFFVSEKGFYLNAQEALYEFSQACIVLLELYESKEKEENKSFNLERNLRLIGPVVLNLCSLSETLTNK